MIDELKLREEAKRSRQQTPAERWQSLLDMIAWAETQVPATARTPAVRKAEERRKLAELCAWQAAQRGGAADSGSSIPAQG